MAGREIIEQLPPGMKIDAIVQGVGTGGTLIAWHRLKAIGTTRHQGLRDGANRIPDH